MLSSIKCLIGALLLGALTIFIRPTPAQAADARCLRLTILWGENLQTAIFYDYNLSTKDLTSFSQSESLNWYDEAPDGRWVAMKLNGPDKGKEFIRFVDRVTQRSVEYPLVDVFNSGPSQGGRLTPTGWSPDSQYFAMPVTNYTNEVEEGSLLIFGRDRSLITQVPYNESGGNSVWSWLPDSKRIVMAQGVRSETSSDKMDYTVGVASISGTVIESPIAEPIYGFPFVIPSPDGDFTAVLDVAGLFVMDNGTGEIVTVSLNVPPYQTLLDVAWSSDSKTLLYKTPADSSEANQENIMRYNTATQDSAVVLENVTLPYVSGSYTADGVPVPEEGAMLVRQQDGEGIHFQLIDAQSGTIQEVAQEAVGDGSLAAMYDWSRLGDVVWMSEATTTFFRPETGTRVTLPEGSTLVSMYNALMGRWSENGEWISVLVQNSNATIDLTVINTRTGEVRTIPTATIPDYETTSLYAITSNTGVVLIDQGPYLNLVSADGSLTPLSDSLYWSGMEYGNNGAVWSPDGTKLALIEESLVDYNLTIVKIFQSNGTLIDSVEVPVAPSSIESLNWLPCL